MATLEFHASLLLSRHRMKETGFLNSGNKGMTNAAQHGVVGPNAQGKFPLGRQLGNIVPSIGLQTLLIRYSKGGQ